jgi:hypothetical protein
MYWLDLNLSVSCVSINVIIQCMYLIINRCMSLVVMKFGGVGIMYKDVFVLSIVLSN